MKPSSKTRFSASLQPIIREKITLAGYTSFNIGGSADLFAEPKTQEELIALITEARRLKIPIFILGGGSNTLFSDKGFRGLIIRPLLKKIHVSDDTIIAESGALLSQVVQTAAKNELSGIEGWIGLPGTVGGAVRGNAGASDIETKDIVSSATILDLKKNRIIEYSNKQLKFAYRHSILKKNRSLIVLSATFTFKQKLAAQKQQSIMQEILKKRHLSQPKGKSAGCIFKNPTSKRGRGANPVSVLNHISAGRLIDECGLKGLHIGGIEVSATHGNFLQNLGGATQGDAVKAIKKIKQEVYRKRKIRLEEEVEIVPEK